jgi:hypothetical protein
MGFMPYNHIENDEVFQLKNLMGSMKLCHTTQLKMMKPLKHLKFFNKSCSLRKLGYICPEEPWFEPPIGISLDNHISLRI